MPTTLDRFEAYLAPAILSGPATWNIIDRYLIVAADAGKTYPAIEYAVVAEYDHEVGLTPKEVIARFLSERAEAIRESRQ